MSRVPSNAEQFMGGMQMGAQNLQGARENWAIKQQDLRARQGLGLERDKMVQQGQQFRMGLQAEAENYRKLNESRERMQQAEMAQQGAQFDKRMAFDKQQSDIDNAIKIKMEQIQNEREMNEKAIQALAKNDPRIAQYRARRRELQVEKDKLDGMASSTQAALNMLTAKDGIHDTKFNDISARLSSYAAGLRSRREGADTAMIKGFQHAMAKGVMDESFWAQAERVGTEQALRSGVQPTGPDGKPSALYAYTEGVSQLLGESLRRFFGSTGDPALAEAQASEFMKNPKAMAVQVIHSAIDLNRDAFGLEPGEAKNAAMVAGDIATKAALLSEYGSAMGDGAAMMREEMAKGVGKLRQLGMDDTQISAIFDGLENIGSNRTELLAQYTESADRTQFDLLDNTLSGMASVGDQVQGVLIDEKLMKPVGGVVHDLSRFDMVKALDNARKSIQYANDPQYDGFMEDIDAMRSMGMMTPEQEATLRQILTEVPPEVETLDPRVYQKRAKDIGAKQTDIARSLAGGAEDEGNMLESVIAEQQYLGGMDTASRLEELARMTGVNR
jgi:hypothetical protein